MTKSVRNELSKLFEKLTKYFFAELTDNFKLPRLFPVLWVDEGLELNDEMTDLVKRDLTNVLNLVSILQWTFVGLGVLLFVGALIWFFMVRSKKSKKTSSVDPIYTVKG